MKGIVFNLLEEVVTSNYGESTWDKLLDDAGLDGVYTSLGNYPDESMQALVMAASAALNVTPFEATRWFGRKAMPLLATRFPGFFTAQPSARSFLLSVNNIIHPEVRKLYPAADCPTFEFRDAPNGALLMGYSSPRRLCALAQGFTEGAADHYGETVSFEHLQCMHKGNASCLCQIAFSPSEKG